MNEIDDSIPTFDDDINFIEFLQSMTTLNYDDEGNRIPGYAESRVLAEMMEIDEESILNFAKENRYVLYDAQIEGEEAPQKF